jgi:hypothetical protein
MVPSSASPHLQLATALRIPPDNGGGELLTGTVCPATGIAWTLSVVML